MVVWASLIFSITICNPCKIMFTMFHEMISHTNTHTFIQWWQIVSIFIIYLDEFILLSRLSFIVIHVCQLTTGDKLTYVPGSTYIETLSTSTTNPTLRRLPDLQYLLYDIKDQLRSSPSLDLSANIKFRLILFTF